MLFILFLILIVFSKSSTAIVENNAKAMFVFGDSLVDGGNNDFLDTVLKCNFFPYGVDFPLGTTGRCTNGRNPADIVAQLLGLPQFLPVFYDPLTRGSSILAGVNYASAAAGILDSTNQINNVTSLSHQITNFLEATLRDLKSQLNESVELSSYLSHSIFLFCIGGVDYIWSCTASGRAVGCDLQGLTESLIQNYTSQLKRIYDSGARKFVVLNVLQNGCDPYFKTPNNGSCLELLNDASVLFNNALRAALNGLSQDMPGFAFVYVNASGIVSEIISHPAAYGLNVIDEACCLISESTGGFGCKEGAEPCPDRRIYAYYDSVHPTEKIYVRLCTRAYSSQLQSEAYPFNIEVLANLITTSDSTTLVAAHGME